MAQQARWRRYLDAAEDQFTAAAKAVHVETMTDTKLFCHRYSVGGGIMSRTGATFNRIAPRIEVTRGDAKNSKTTIACPVDRRKLDRGIACYGVPSGYLV